MNKFVVALWALVCGANALYHFRVNLPDPCDVFVSVLVSRSDVKTLSTMRYHGTFELFDFNVTNAGASQVLSRQLVRPDYAEPGKVAKVFGWTPFACGATQIDKDEGMLSSIDYYFVHKEPSVFHGFKCTVMYNATNSEHYFVDEDLGALLGITNDDYEGVFKFVKARDNTPEKFVLDKKEQSSCGGDAFVPPAQAAYDAACKHARVNFNAVLRSFARLK